MTLAVTLLRSGGIAATRLAQRQMVTLRDVEGLSSDEVCRILGITEGNVKVRVFRAREQLAKLIGEDDVYMP